MEEKSSEQEDIAAEGNEKAGGALSEEMSFHHELLRRTGKNARAEEMISHETEALEGVGSENDANSDSKDLPGSK